MHSNMQALEKMEWNDKEQRENGDFLPYNYEATRSKTPHILQSKIQINMPSFSDFHIFLENQDETSKRSNFTKNHFLQQNPHFMHRLTFVGFPIIPAMETN